MPGDWITSIAIDKYNNKWIGTYYSGLVVFREGGVILSSEDEEELLKEQSDIICFPNPVTDNINIKMNNPGTGYITLKLFDLFGREIMTVYKGYSDRNLNINHHLDNLSSGTYFLVMTSQAGRQAHRIEVVR